VLLEKCRKGDQEACSRLLEAHKPLIASVVSSSKWGFRRHEHEDLIQESMIEVVKAVKNFEPRARVSTFVHTIAYRCCVALIRKKAAEKRINDFDCVPLAGAGTDDPDNPGVAVGDPGPNQEEMVLHREKIGLLKRALASLDAKCKDLVRMRFFDGYSFKDIAARLKAKENTVLVQLKRCLQTLQGQVSAEY
jgi:RNA polymerase sigma-70 factor (ECF subfamily)